MSVDNTSKWRTLVNSKVWRQRVTAYFNESSDLGSRPSTRAFSLYILKAT